jgi:hypothetical protein
LITAFKKFLKVEYFYSDFYILEIDLCKGHVLLLYLLGIDFFLISVPKCL